MSSDTLKGKILLIGWNKGLSYRIETSIIQIRNSYSSNPAFLDRVGSAESAGSIPVGGYRGVSTNR